MIKQRNNLVAKLEEGGRIMISAAYRKAAEIKPGDRLIMILEEDGTIRIIPPKAAIKQIRELVRKYIPEGRLLSEELIQERRAEALNE